MTLLAWEGWAADAWEGWAEEGTEEPAVEQRSRPHFWGDLLSLQQAAAGQDEQDLVDILTAIAPVIGMENAEWHTSTA